MVTTKIIFDRKKKAKKEGTGTIEIRVTFDRRAIYISTGVRVREKEWKVGRVVNRPDAPALNERIGIIYEIVDREANASIKAGRPINTDEIKKKVWNEKEVMSDDIAPTMAEIMTLNTPNDFSSLPTSTTLPWTIPPPSMTARSPSSRLPWSWIPRVRSSASRVCSDS